MSMFSGKCDLCDHFEIATSGEKKTTLQQEIDKTRFFITTRRDHRDHEVVIKSEKDLAKYYPYLIVMGGFSCEGSTIHLSSMPYIDLEERERIQSYLGDILVYWRRCKRKKMVFSIEDAVNNTYHFSSSSIVQRIAEVVAEHGDKTTLEHLKHIHFKMHEYYRNIWYEELLRVGWNEFEASSWVYGYYGDKDKYAERIKAGRDFG